MRKVATVVVTYNRKELLFENINALLESSEESDIYIIDNASTDGTYEYIKAQIEDANDTIIYKNTGYNLGGAGGFEYGISVAENAGYKYIWVMDDDSIPYSDALTSLINKARSLNNEFSYLASAVRWVDGNVCIMNRPTFNLKRNNGQLDMAISNKLIPVYSSSFVGCFINAECSKKVGLPIGDFFIYGDDQEYTMRLGAIKPAYLDLDSIIVHKTKANFGSDIVSCETDRIQRYYYAYRNGIYIARKQGVLPLIKMIGKAVLITTPRVLRSHSDRLLRFRTMYKGIKDGIMYNPKIKQG